MWEKGNLNSDEIEEKTNKLVYHLIWGTNELLCRQIKVSVSAGKVTLKLTLK